MWQTLRIAQKPQVGEFLDPSDSNSVAMPLYELYRMTKANANSSQDLNPPCSSGQSSLAENDLCELVWENGQILVQGHSSTPKRAAASKSLPSQCLPSYSPRARDRHIGNSSNSKTGKFGEFESAVIDDIPMSVPSSDMALHQDEDLVPWLSYAINHSHHSQHHQYSSELLPELSVVTSNESSRNNYSLFDKRSSDDSHAIRNSNKHYGHDGGVAILDSSSSRLYQSSSLQSQTSIEIQNKGSNEQSHLFSDNLTQVRSARGFPDFKMQTQDLKLPNSSSTMMNFSHFAHPAALLRNNLKTSGAACGLSSATTDTVASKAKDFAERSKHSPISTTVESNNGNANKSTSEATNQPSTIDLPPMESKPDEHRAAPIKPSEPVGQADAAQDEQDCSQVPAENARRGVTDGEKSIEPAVASSVCSGNSVEKASEDLIRHKRRRSRDNDESECHSEDVEDESLDAKHLAAARGGLGSKRSRAAQVHNLSERRRRDRINEKMRALQELIPNCNKVDKASMLDEAIEYLKTLQLQVQMMSVGGGLYMPQMMFPTGMQHNHSSHMPSFSPMGVGMHMGFGMGYGMVIPDNSGSTPVYPMMPLPTVRGTHFTAPPRSMQTGLHGMTASNIEAFGQPSQGLPVSMSDQPLFLGTPLMKSMEVQVNGYEAGGRTGNMCSALDPGNEDSTVHMISQVTPTTGANEEFN